MARLSVYVPDDLKARMDDLGDDANWSSIAQAGFQKAVAELEHRKHGTMTTAVERLRASKQQYLADVGENAERRGREWAANKADYRDLVRMAAIDESYLDADDPSGAGLAVMKALDPDGDAGFEDVCNHLGIDESEGREDAFIASFARGVQAFYDEVSDQL